MIKYINLLLCSRKIDLKIKKGIRLYFNSFKVLKIDKKRDKRYYKKFPSFSPRSYMLKKNVFFFEGPLVSTDPSQMILFM